MSGQRSAATSPDARWPGRHSGTCHVEEIPVEREHQLLATDLFLHCPREPLQRFDDGSWLYSTKSITERWDFGLRNTPSFPARRRRRAGSSTVEKSACGSRHASRNARGARYFARSQARKPSRKAVSKFGNRGVRIRRTPILRCSTADVVSRGRDSRSPAPRWRTQSRSAASASVRHWR